VRHFLVGVHRPHRRLDPAPAALGQHARPGEPPVHHRPAAAGGQDPVNPGQPRRAQPADRERCRLRQVTADGDADRDRGEAVPERSHQRAVLGGDQQRGRPEDPGCQPDDFLSAVRLLDVEVGRCPPGEHR